MVRISLLCFSLIVGNVLARPALDVRSDSEHQQLQSLQMRREATNSAPLESELMRRATTHPPSSSPPSSPLSLTGSHKGDNSDSTGSHKGDHSDSTGSHKGDNSDSTGSHKSDSSDSTGSHKGDNSDNEEKQEEYLREDWEVTADVAAALAKDMDTVTLEQLTRRSIDTSKSEVVHYLERRVGPFPSLLTIARFFHKKPDARKLLFWSKVTLGTAKRFGNTKNLQLLSDLMNGGDFEKWTRQKIAWSQKAPWWERLSAGMAVKAAIDKREVWVMIPKSGMMTPTSVWNRIERPHLQKRNIKINWVDEKGNSIPEAEVKWPGKA